MANSIITITFNNDIPIDGKFYLGIGHNNSDGCGSVGINKYKFIWKNLRSSSYEVEVGLPTSILGERSAINFIEAITRDILSVNRYIINRNANVVTITAETTSGNGISNFTYFYSPVTITNSITGQNDVGVNNQNIGIAITNVTCEEFNIGSIQPRVSTTPCSSVLMAVYTSELATKIISPIAINNNTENPFIFDAIRQQDLEVIVENINGVQVSKLITTPYILDVNKFHLQINNSPNGASVIVNNDTMYGLIFNYSLDDINWNTLNIFNGLIEGSYTLYIRDQYGCKINKQFVVNSYGIKDPYFYISKANSIRYANRITWEDSKNYKTDENTLSCEVDVQMAYKELQQFQSTDIITTQFKSNYLSNVASIIKEDETIVDIPVVKKAKYIRIKDKRDAIKYNLENGKTGIYFLQGNIYDYDTGVATGESYTLNGYLPLWGVIGNFLLMDMVWYLIEDIVFNSSRNADVIVISNIYTGADVVVQVGTIYNQLDYDVYEYSINMIDYVNQKFTVKLVNSDPYFTTITHLSETIWCKVKHENVLEIKYYNTTNTDVMYSTGIIHKIRIPYLKVSGKLEENSEIYKTDTNVVLLNTDLYEIDEFKFEPVTKELWRKIMIALSHEKVFINEVQYVKSGGFNTEGQLEQSNLYVLTATMIKTGNVYNSQTNGNLDISAFEIPGLMTTQNGYIKY